jgi:hypothetical protein
MELEATEAMGMRGVVRGVVRGAVRGPVRGPVRVMLIAGLLLPLLALSACGGNSNPDFSLTVVEPNVTLVAGGVATVDFNVGSVKGSHGSIILSLHGLPAGVGVAPATATVGIGSPQRFYLTAANSAPPTPSPVTIAATGDSGFVSTSGVVTQTATFALTVVPAPTTP